MRGDGVLQAGPGGGLRRALLREAAGGQGAVRADQQLTARRCSVWTSRTPGLVPLTESAVQLLRACLGQLNRNHGAVFMHAYIYC
jgi:hypothetical protein